MMRENVIPAKLLKSREEAADAIAEIDLLWGAPAGTAERDRLEVLVLLVEDFERREYPEDTQADPVDVIHHRMEALGLTRRDLEPMIGPSSRVSDVLNRKRGLSLRMIKNLSLGLGVPVGVLVGQ